MSGEEHRLHQQRRFRRIRRTKQLLRYLPRRATIHRYPVLRWFAAFARSKPYLWSFKLPQMRPAFYAGSILAMMPLTGIQVPISLGLSLILRANLPVMAGIQFVSNPFTVAPIYYGTYKLGQAAISISGMGRSAEVIDINLDEELDTSAIFDSPEAFELPNTVVEPTPAELRWTSRLGTAVNAMMIGGFIAGGVLGFVLDLLYRIALRGSRRHHAKMSEPNRSGSTKVPSTAK